MRRQHFIFLIVFVAIPIVIYAQSSRTATQDPQQVAFLESGTDYLINFPKDRHPLSHYSTACDIFRVVRHHETGSWILVEHPASPADMGTWLLKHWAPFLPDQSSDISADDLDRVKEAVAREIKLERTWVNLDHAITVRSVSAQSLGINDLGLSEE